MEDYGICDNCEEKGSKILVNKNCFVSLCRSCEKLGPDDRIGKDRTHEDLRRVMDIYLHRLNKYTHQIEIFTQTAHNQLNQHKAQALIACHKIKLKVAEILKKQNEHIVSLPLNFSISSSLFKESLDQLFLLDSGSASSLNFDLYSPSPSSPVHSQDPTELTIHNLNIKIQQMESFINQNLYHYKEISLDSLSSDSSSVPYLYYDISYNLYRIDPLTYQTSLLCQNCDDFSRAIKCVLPNSDIFFAGSSCEFTNRVYIFNMIGKRVYRLPNMSINRSSLGMVYTHNSVYVFGGSGTNRAERYDLGSNRWVKLPDSLINHESCQCVEYDELIYIISGNYLGSVEVFNTVKCEYSLHRNTVIPIVKAAFRVDELIYLIGEHDLQILNDRFEIVTEERNKWNLNSVYENQVHVLKEGFVFISQYGYEILYFEMSSREIHNMKDLKVVNYNIL